MNILPTMEGGLRLEIESPGEWAMLAQIASDADDQTQVSLPETLSALMDEDTEWDDLVAPDLQLHFSEQLAHISTAIAHAEQQSEGEEGELFILRQDSEHWYGALNQARLALESRYHFGPTEDIEEIASFPPNKQFAFVRSQFYCRLQSVLLEYAMD